MLWFSKHKKPVDKTIVDLTIQDFYANKIVIKTDWWLSWCDPVPNLVWARSRTYSDGTADASFDGLHCYGFENERYAGLYLSEDEFTRLATFDEYDEADINVKVAQLIPPTWSDETITFDYVGKY